MEDAMAKMDTAILDNMIVGRVEPHIYAFSTQTVPNYLKVGDTSRGVRVRLEEWRKIFPDLISQYEHSAQIDDKTIFRDFAVHNFLEQEKRRIRLRPDTFDHLPYYSKEFFEDATTEDLNEAIVDIYRSAYEKNGKYQFYSSDRLPQILTYERIENYPPRDNQQQAIDNFKKAVDAGRTNLLLYAVMRFGKSFTSMCCAKEINARFVVIVSAKADVKEEWKKTIESHKYFEGYHYLDSEALKRNETVVADTLVDQNKKVALFLTLQDLQGDDIKEKHKEVFNHQIDLLIIDETHFGARGESYGKILQKHLTAAQIKKELGNDDDSESIEAVKGIVKTLRAKVSLHLSGTPYRILMSDEFQKEDIIAFVQFTDIIDAQQRWDDEHLKEDDCDEWENPYYGFPQMIRFAFNPNESSRKKMEQMRKEGITCAFSELFRPLSMTAQTDGSHRRFNHEAEILDLLEVIDGSKDDENLLGFLDYDKIKDGKMCRHIVCVLPFRASCDAMAALIRNNKGRFNNLGDYEIINIAGFDDEYKYKSTGDVKRAIKECEARNKKTLTLTVNRMLTGTTVPQWDTMLYLKGTVSPQEYDQAIFRLQNQYITTFKNESGKTIKYNMKPQTLLVDFDPNRMFILQELKSQFYNVNTEMQGNAQLKERIARELAVSPISVLNKNKLQRVTPTNITDAVREYSRARSILDDALEIPTDNDLLQDDALAAILRTIEPINAKNGLQIKPTEGEGDDIDAPDGDGTDDSENTDQKDNPPATPKQPTEPIENDNLEKRLAAYYARILFFAFLTESTVKSLEDVIGQIPATEDNRRVAKHLGLDVETLNLIQSKSNPFVLRKFDYTIENTNDLVRDDRLEPIRRVEVAMHKFGRLSDSEVVTPAMVADNMVSILPFDDLNTKENARFIDIASKQGEFTISLYKKFGDKVKDSIYAIPTSKLTYEFIRKTYKLLEMPIDNIFADFTSYDLIGENNKKIIKKLTDMKFDVIIGNPPYQANDGSGASSDAAAPLYQKFVEQAKLMQARYIDIIMPSKWMVGGRTELNDFRRAMQQDKHLRIMIDYENAATFFPNLHIDGGICYFLRDNSYEDKIDYTFTANDGTVNNAQTLISNYSSYIIRDTRIISILDKTCVDSKFSSIVSKTRPFGIRKDLFNNPEKYANANLQGQKFSGALKIYGVKGIKGGARRTEGYVKSELATDRYQAIDKYKIFFTTTYSTNATIPPSAIKADPGEICTETFLLIGPFDSKQERDNCIKYMQTHLFLFLLYYGHGTMQVNQSVFDLIPLVDFSKPWTDTELYAKYGLSSDEIAFIDSMIKPMK